MRRLTLRKETVAELTTEQLGDVVGGAPTIVFCYTAPPRCPISWDACFTTHGCAE